jgi:hypothetical protein
MVGSKVDPRWDDRRRSSGGFGAWLSRRSPGMLRAAHRRDARVRLGLSFAAGLIWFVLSFWAAADHTPKPPAPASQNELFVPAPQDFVTQTLAGAADRICVLRSGKPCDYRIWDWRLALAQSSLAVLAAFTLLFGLWSQLLAALANMLRQYGRGHIIVTGEGPQAEHLARAVAETRAVVLARREASSSEVAALGADGVALHAGPPVEPRVIKAAGLRSADRIVAVSQSDAQNIAVAKAAQEVWPDAPPGTIAVRVEDGALRALLPADGPLHAADTLSLAEVSARLLTRSPGWLDLAAAHGYRRVHVGIVGWDATAVAAATRVLRMMWAPDLDSPAVTIFAPPGLVEKAKAHFDKHLAAARDPAFAWVWSQPVQFAPYEWRDEADVWAPLLASHAAGPLTAIVVSFASDEETLQCAAALASAADRQTASLPALHVRENQEGTIGLALAGTRTLKVETFGDPDEVLSEAILLDGELDRVARQIHEGYIHGEVLRQHATDHRAALRAGVTLGQKFSLAFNRLPAGENVTELEQAFSDRFGPDALQAVRTHTALRLLVAGRFQPRHDRPAQRPWTELREHYVNSNRLAADHAIFKVTRRPPANGKAYTPSEITDDLCELEHRRWAADLLLSGWRWGARDERARLHPDLRPYSAYGPEEGDVLRDAIEKDRDMWRAAPVQTRT